MSKRSWRPIAAPTNSAMSVAIATISAWIQRKMFVRREKRSRQTSGRFLPRRDPELRAHGLDEHRHEIGGEDDPEQEVAELRAGGHVRREVPRVDVGDGGDERRPEERPQRRAAPDGRPASDSCGGGEHPRLAREDVVERMLWCGAVVSERRALAEVPSRPPWRLPRLLLRELGWPNSIRAVTSTRDAARHPPISASPCRTT